MDRLRGRQEGSTSVELMGILPILLLGALAAWQILLVAMTVTSAENAARTASRAHATQGNAEGAGIRAMPQWLRDGARVQMSGDKATVVVEVPIIFPGLRAGEMTVSRSAELPSG
jgi:hypothetical protein